MGGQAGAARQAVALQRWIPVEAVHPADGVRGEGRCRGVSAALQRELAQSGQQQAGRLHEEAARRGLTVNPSQSCVGAPGLNRIEMEGEPLSVNKRGPEEVGAEDGLEVATKPTSRR